MPIDDGTTGRLASSRDSDGQAFLLPHHLLAASRLERLIQRAQLTPRLTMSYDSARIGQPHRAGSAGAADLAASASEARHHLHRLAQALPVDCWNVVFDVCGLGKGLQTIETERRWPRRSAKLVLRIGLSQLAAHWGLEPVAAGPDQARRQVWHSEILPIIADSRI